MLWTVPHRRPWIATYSFNCYCHQIRLLCRQPSGKPEIILSQVGVTQGDPPAIVLYGIALLPLAEALRKEVPDVLQPWYANDAAMQGPPDCVAACFKLLCKIGPMFGYYPEPKKSFAICPLVVEAEVKEVFNAEGLAVQTCRGHRYVGGYVGSLAMRNRWVEPMVAQWVDVHLLDVDRKSVVK